MPTAPLTSPPPVCFGDQFDSSRGLWSYPDNSHQSASALLASLPRAHSLPRNAARLVVAAQLDHLAEEPLDAVLAGLRHHQCLDHSRLHGNFAWWSEEGRVTDTNAAFFVGLNLCVLRLRFASQLSPSQRSAIDTIARDLAPWFDHAITEQAAHYPNKYLGDLVCACLLNEILQHPTSPVLHQAILDASAYWLEQGWGWGEHLSDIYAGVMLNQLGTVLLLAPNLPPDLTLLFSQLFRDLLRLEIAFSGGSRLPALRSYSVAKAPAASSFLQRLRPWHDWHDATAHPTEASIHFAFGHFFAIDKLLPRFGGDDFTPPPPSRSLSLPCLRGAVASAAITPRYRLGSVSHFPLMPEAEYPNWGLSWQSFPVAFTSAPSGWGFLRWRTREEGRDLAHPSIDRNLDKALSLTVTPSLHGYTESRQQGPRIVALRRMPVVSLRWEYLTDAIELIGFQPENLHPSSLPHGGQLLSFDHHGQPWSFGHHPLVSAASPQFTSHEHGPAWAVTWPATALHANARIAHLWWLAPGPQPSPHLSCLPQTGPFISEQARAYWHFTWPAPPEAPPDSPDWSLSFDLRRPLGLAFDQPV